MASAQAEPGQIGFALIDQTGEFAEHDRIFDQAKGRWVKVKNKGSLLGTIRRNIRKMRPVSPGKETQKR